MRRTRRESGAAAVEFALVAPILILLVLGIIEFGRVYNTQLSLTSAAREGVRVMAIKNDPSAARTATRNAAPSVSPALTNAEITISPAGCASGSNVTVTIHHSMSFISGLFGDGLTLSGKAVMRCSG